MKSACLAADFQADNLISKPPLARLPNIAGGDKILGITDNATCQLLLLTLYSMHF